jgi:hypothetical protein
LVLCFGDLGGPLGEVGGADWVCQSRSREVSAAVWLHYYQIYRDIPSTQRNAQKFVSVLLQSMLSAPQALQYQAGQNRNISPIWGGVQISPA